MRFCLVICFTVISCATHDTIPIEERTESNRSTDSRGPFHEGLNENAWNSLVNLYNCIHSDVQDEPLIPVVLAAIDPESNETVFFPFGIHTFLAISINGDGRVLRYFPQVVRQIGTMRLLEYYNSSRDSEAVPITFSPEIVESPSFVPSEYSRNVILVPRSALSYSPSRIAGTHLGVEFPLFLINKDLTYIDSNLCAIHLCSVLGLSPDCNADMSFMFELKENEIESVEFVLTNVSSDMMETIRSNFDINLRSICRTSRIEPFRNITEVVCKDSPTNVDVKYLYYEKARVSRPYEESLPGSDAQYLQGRLTFYPFRAFNIIFLNDLMTLGS